MAESKKKSSSVSNVMIPVEGTVMVALAVVLSFIRPVRLQWGASITLLSMLPICMFSIRRGVRAGLGAAFVFSLFQFGIGVTDGLFGWGLTVPMLLMCILADYILAYTAVGLAGVFRRRGMAGRLLGIVFALMLRFLCHFMSGVVVWKTVGQLWESDLFINNQALYSLVYNGAYMLPEIILTVTFAAVLMKNKASGKYFEAV